ncbi:hypothetical protein B0O99DRAFT_688830 [Bisporella sp. PMI_857]|nr:hypothetical protein B0O99DRAFT_688830 [Bisporella sp. PMI_857]
MDEIKKIREAKRAKKTKFTVAHRKNMSSLSKGEGKDYLSTLPGELINKIFEDLDNKISSTCLGLTCKRLYNVHWSLHGKMKVVGRFGYSVLGEMLCEWMRKGDYQYCDWHFKFTRKDSNGCSNCDSTRALERQWDQYFCRNKS